MLLPPCVLIPRRILVFLPNIVLFWRCFQLEQLMGSLREGGTAPGAMWGSRRDWRRAPRGDPGHGGPIPQALSKKQLGRSCWHPGTYRHSSGDSGAIFAMEEKQTLLPCVRAHLRALACSSARKGEKVTVYKVEKLKSLSR